MIQPNQTENNKPSKRPYRWLRRILRTFLGITILFVLLVLFVRSPWGQNIITDKLVNYVSEKTGTTIKIEKLFITIEGNLQLDGLYLEDKTGDTLIYSKSIEANLPLWKSITGEAYGLDQIQWKGLTANIIRKDSISGFNFQFLIDAFTSEDESSDDNSDSEAINLSLGEISFKDFNIKYFDEITGIDSHFKIGQFNSELKTIDLETMQFDAGLIELSNSNIKLYQKTVAENDDNTTTALPKLSVEKLILNQVQTDFKSESLAADVDIKEFYSEIPNIDLTRNQFNFEIIELKNSIVNINIKSENQSKVESAPNNQNQTFEWPELEVEVPTVNLENNSIQYTLDDNQPQKNRFNPNAVFFENLSLQLKGLFYKDKEVGLLLNQFSFDEISGLNLKEFKGDFTISDQKLSANEIYFVLNNNQITGFAGAQYKSLQDLIDTPERTALNMNLTSFEVAMNDLLKFQPDLAKNPYLKTLSQKPLFGNTKASGTLQNLNIPTININWGKSTSLSTSALLQNLSSPESIKFDIPKFSAQTSKSDLTKFVNEKELGVVLPKNVQLNGQLSGTAENITTDAMLQSSQGLVTFKGWFNNQVNIEYDSKISIENYRLDELLQDPQLGKLSLELSTSGSGSSLNTLTADVKATISEFIFNNYSFKDMKIGGSLENGNGKITTHYKDENLNINAVTELELDSIKTKAIVNIDLKGANLMALGLMQREVKTGFNLNVDFRNIKEVFSVKAKMRDGVVVYDNKSYLIGDVDAAAKVSSDTTMLSVSNKILNLNLKSNTDPQRFSKALNRHISGYFYSDDKPIDSLAKLIKVNLQGKISQSPLLKQVFLVNLKDLDTITLALDFDEKQRKFNAIIKAPHINYAGNEIDSLKFRMNTDKEKFSFDFGFNNLNAGPIDIPKTRISGSKLNDGLGLKFEAINDDKYLIYANSKFSNDENNRLVYHINTDSLIINARNWEMPEKNAAIYVEDSLIFKDFRIQRNDQSIEITDNLSDRSKPQIALGFTNFKLSQFLNYLNPETEIAKGRIDGDLTIENPFTSTGIMANMSVSQFEILKTDLGTLKFKAESLGNSAYDFSASLKEANVNLDLDGTYEVTNEKANLDLDLVINEFKMKALDNLSLGEVKEGQGSFSGQFKITGTPTNPEYIGNLNFDNAGFKITKLNTNFLLKDERLKINNEGLSLNNFTVSDANDNKLVVSGDIGTKNLINPTFNLKLKANDFKVLDASKNDNELFYGKAIFDADANLTGDLQIPKLDARLEVDSKTDFVYVLPESTASVEKRDGIVTFVNRKNPDAILTSNERRSASVSGFDINCFIKVNEQAKFKIILDKGTGDNFQIQGNGELNLKMFPNGRINLSGIYEASKGSYKLSLYNLVKREFTLAPGSRVTWNGDPFNAQLDVSAIYSVEASASSLMAPQISGIDPSMKSKYRQVLPFEVYLNIEGELFQPEISFRLDMPEEERDAISGQVYSRVKQVNQLEAELNQQVFSLLVLNRFYPSPGSDGSSGGIETLAQQNLNDAISDQLNAFSDKILGDSGIELDFGLDSYTDYQGDAPTERTQLNVAAQKKLLNDRLTVRVGSDINVEGGNTTGEATPVVGNVSLIYELTKDGRYRLKGFRRNKFENIIDGQTIVSGIALIFTQEFNKFDELWQAIFKKSKEQAESKSNEKNKTTEKNSDDESENENN